MCPLLFFCARQNGVVVKISKLTRKYRNVYYPTWEECVEEFLNNEHDANIVRQLVAVLEGGEEFKNPVTVNKKYVVNGTHRVVASIIANKPHIVVRKEIREDSNVDGFHVTTLRLKESVSDEQFAFLSEALRSIPLYERGQSVGWFVASITAISSSRVLETYWGEGEVSDRTVSLLHQNILSILRDCGVEVETISTGFEADYEG